MGDIWMGQRNRPLQLLAVQLETMEKRDARSREAEEGPLPFHLMQNDKKITAEELAGMDILYLTARTEAYREVSALAGWARQQGLLVLWNPGGLKNARILPAPGCVILQSGLNAEEEWEALWELFCTPSLTTTLDRMALMQRLRAASQVRLAMAQASGSGKNQSIGNSLAGQGWQMPREGAMVVSIEANVNCRLEEVVELWHGTVKRTAEMELLWGTAFHLEQPDTLRLILLAMSP